MVTNHNFTLSKHASERLAERKGIKVPAGSVIASKHLDWLYNEVYRFGDTFLIIKNGVVLTAY